SLNRKKGRSSLTNGKREPLDLDASSKGFAWQLPRTPETNYGPNFRGSKAPNLNGGGNCHQDRQSSHDHVQPARRGCLPFSGLLMVLDGDPQAVHGIDVVCHGRYPVVRSQRHHSRSVRAVTGRAGRRGACRSMRRFWSWMTSLSWTVTRWSARSRSRS